MKTLYLSIILLLLNLSSFAQGEVLTRAIEQRELEHKEANLDTLNLSYPATIVISKDQVFENGRPYKQKQRLLKIESLKEEGVYIPRDSIAAAYLFSLGITNEFSPQKIYKGLQEINSYVTLKSMLLEMDRFIYAAERYVLSPQKEDNHTFYLKGLYDNKTILTKQLEYITENQFEQYAYSNTSKAKFKSINFYHDNDFFNPPINQDMNYTGGLKVELTTDLLKLRLIEKLNNSNVLSYQSVLFGIKANTPYIRFDSVGRPLEAEFKDHYSRDVNQWFDRPFGSFTYIGRAKYRINYQATVRSKGELLVGVIGGDVGSDFQAAIHRDLTLKSPKPIGWERQISNGGRFGLNLNQELEFMLASSSGSIFKPNKNVSGSRAHFYGKSIINFGSYISKVGLGLGLSNLSFKDRSGTELIKENSLSKKRFVATAELSYDYVLHDTILEGFGWLKTNEKDNDGSNDEKVSVYKFDRSLPAYKNVVNRHRLRGTLFLGFRINKTMIFYKWAMQNREFFPENISYSSYFLANNNDLGVDFTLDPKKLYNNKKWYGFGRLGFNFIL